jgi:hypothetical protein
MNTMRPKTLLEIAGASPSPARLSDAVVVVIDAQHEYVDGALPLPGIGPEAVLSKRLPNAFASTDLADRVAALKRPGVILVGFMTHMCVEATARSAIDQGLTATVIASATATRNLPDPLTGGIVPAAEVQRNALAALSDRFATIVPTVDDIRD